MCFSIILAPCKIETKLATWFVFSNRVWSLQPTESVNFFKKFIFDKLHFSKGVGYIDTQCKKEKFRFFKILEVFIISSSCVAPVEIIKGFLSFNNFSICF